MYWFWFLWAYQKSRRPKLWFWKKQSHNNVWVWVDVEESLSLSVKASKFIPKSHRYLVFAVKSGTKLLCYAAAVRRQFFGKWLHLNMRRAQAVQGHQARDEGWKQLPSSHVVCSTSCHTKQNCWARRTLIAESPILFLKVLNQCQRRWGKSFSPMLKVTLSKIGFLNSKA